MSRTAQGVPARPPGGGRSGSACGRAGQGQASARAAGHEAVPPACNTGAHLTFHWLRGGFELDVGDVVDLVSELTDGGYAETHDWGRYFYKRHHEFVAGLRVYFEPAAPNMPPVLVDAPGAACEFLGMGALRTLFCNAVLSRIDIAFDGAPFSPAEMADHVRAGDVRCKSKSRHFIEDLGDEPDGNTLSLGSRASHRYLRIYDGRGPTRVELELKGKYARAMKEVLLSDLDALPEMAMGVVRDFVDFIDSSADSNQSRAPLIPAWAAFVQRAARTRLNVVGNPVPTAARLKRYIEYQVAATLYTYVRLGSSIHDLLHHGRTRLRSRHRSLLAQIPPSGFGAIGASASG